MIRVRNLCKEYRVPVHHRGAFGAILNLFDPHYDVVRAVDGISFEIEPGEFVGFIGPNGAGKSTTVKVLTGVLEPTSGEVRVSGRVPRLERIPHVAHLGVVFGQRTQLWWDLPVIESYALLQHVYAVGDSAFHAQRDRLIDLLDLSGLLDTPVRKLSLGQRMRCELVGALLHEPDLLFLDEPTLGLDIVAKQAIRQFLAVENEERGTTILLATHDLHDIERLCPRMILIDRGRIRFDGALAELRRRLGRERRLQVDFEGEPPLELPAGVQVEERRPERLVLRFAREDIPAPELIAWLGERCAIADLTLEDSPIEDVIAQIYRTGMEVRPGVRGERRAATHSGRDPGS